ncbi:MAG: gatA, partial [Solirubrobacterales bacterium]|nr:gatA [Solirubrobacterales bacterium]
MTGPGDIATAGAALRAGQTTAVELAERALAAAGAHDRSLGAFAALTPERALRDAARADGELRAGLDRGPLHGLPVSVKDVIDVAGAPTRLGTPGAGHRVPDADAVVVDALARAGAIVVGKAATHELALGMVTPGVANPFDRARMVGGSSGGSAAGVAAGLVVGSLGTDTAGSVRCPAALCGVVGLKPTFGALDTTGVARLAVSQDTVGALAATAADCAALWAALRHGPSPALVLATGYGRVGLDRGVLAERCDASVAAAVTAAAQGLAATGIEIVDVEVQHLALASAVSLVVLLAEAGEAWGEALDRDGGAFGP